MTPVTGSRLFWPSGFVRRVISARAGFNYSLFLFYGFRVARLCPHVPNIRCPANRLVDFACIIISLAV